VRNFILILILITTLLSFSLIKTGNKKLIAHWTSEKDLYDLKINDTLIFTKTKYSDKLYKWGGALAGINLGADNNFSEFNNVLCSDETSPVRYEDEKWNLNNDTITISSSERKMDWKVIHINNKKFIIVVLTTNSR